MVTCSAVRSIGASRPNTWVIHVRNPATRSAGIAIIEVTACSVSGSAKSCGRRCPVREAVDQLVGDCPYRGLDFADPPVGEALLKGPAVPRVVGGVHGDGLPALHHLPCAPPIRRDPREELVAHRYRLVDAAGEDRLEKLSSWLRTNLARA